jgi:hypothetical protein
LESALGCWTNWFVKAESSLCAGLAYFSFLEAKMNTSHHNDVNSRSASLTGGATGPRTPCGKQRSKYNAIKHAIFSSVARLKGESDSELNSLVAGLRKYFQPIGTLEAILVDKLATLFWRLRRLLIAEAAEIQTGITFPPMGKNHRSSKVVTLVVREDGREECELMKGIADPDIREKCLGLLRDLKAEIDTDGFETNRDSAILTKLFGNDTDERQRPTLYRRYRSWLSKANCSEEERQKNGSASPEQCKKSFLEEVEEEIRRLERDKWIESETLRLERLRQYVPDSPQPDRLLRYEASLERNIDRTLSQLERLQRMRLGQAVPPPI